METLTGVNDIEVQLLNMTHEPEMTVINAIRNCRASQGKSDSYQETGRMDRPSIGNKDQNLILNCIDRGHLTPFEFIEFEFEVELSKVAIGQLTRHRTCSFCIESQRSVIPTKFYIPNSFMKSEVAKNRFEKLTNFNYDEYTKLLKEGFSKEDARYTLPENVMGKVCFKCDFRNLRHLLAERLCKHANEEIHKMALEIRKILREKLHPVFLRKMEKYYGCPDASICGACLK